MKIPALLLPLLAGAALVALASPAAAAPLGDLGPVPAVLPGGIHVGFGLTFPVGHPPRHPRRVPVATHPPGRWETLYERVFVPATFLGYDRFGRPVWSEARWTVRAVRVWVPAPPVRAAVPVARPAPYRAPGPRGHVAIGFGFGR